MRRPKPSGFSLEDVLAKSVAAEAESNSATTSAPAAAEPEAWAQGRKMPKTQEAAGIVSVSVHMDPEDRIRLRILSAQTGISMNALGLEAFSLLMEKRGLAPLKKVKANVPDGRRKRDREG